MVILLLFAFISGLVTILAPCIWPLLPIILSSSTTGGHRKPLGITLGIMTSFTIFTLTISFLVSVFHLDPDILRLFAVIIIGFLGLSLVIPALSAKLEVLVSKFSGRAGGRFKNTGNGFLGGFITGFSLGIVWSPCAGPILATIATLAATQAVNLQVLLVTIVYVTGVGVPLFVFSSFGSYLLTKTRTLSSYTGRIQQVFGVVMILTAVLIYTNYDKVLQAKLLDAFPAYTNFIVKLESNSAVTSQLQKLKRNKEPMPTVSVLNPINKAKEEMTLPILGKAPDFVGINHWLNTDKPLTMSELRGKVVLVDFWTYTCINCIRTLPHVVGWYEKYKDKGFVVVGVHTPEFEFEKKTENVANAIKQYKIRYPVAQDNDYKTWEAFNNHYWPAKYLVDKDGNIRYTHFGEGEYEAIEMNIKKLLEKAGNQVDQNVENMPDDSPKMRLTPETYLGQMRMDRLASPENVKAGFQTYSIPGKLSTHNFAYGGQWDVEAEMAVVKQGSVLELSFYANKVFLVIHPAGKADVVKVYLDGKVVDENLAGVDVKNGQVIVSEPRLYNLIDLKDGPSNHLLRLEFESPGTQLFAFTFG